MQPSQDKELAHFNALADVWWDALGPMWPLHKLNTLRVPFITKAIEQHFDHSPNPFVGLTILDIGCGAGLLSESMAKLGASVTAIDPADKNIAVARSHAQSSDLCIDYICGDIHAINGRQFDVVLNMEVVEHVENLTDFMQACGSAVKPKGMHIVATLNRTLKSYIFAIIGAEYILRWLPKGTHSWKKFVTPKEMEQFFTASQFEMQLPVGVSVNPFTKKYYLTSSTLVNYMAVALKS